MGATVAVLAAWPPDLGELISQFVIACLILFAIARYYGTTNDPYWLTPGLFFLGLMIVCLLQSWRLSSGFRTPLFGTGQAVFVLTVAVVGALALALMKAETHSLRRRGKSQK
jgi:hypothetical protein